MAPKQEEWSWQFGHARERTHSASFEWKGDSSGLNQERKKSDAEVAEIHGKNESSICDVVKQEKNSD